MKRGDPVRGNHGIGRGVSVGVSTDKLYASFSTAGTGRATPSPSRVKREDSPLESSAPDSTRRRDVATPRSARGQQRAPVRHHGEIRASKNPSISVGPVKVNFGAFTQLRRSTSGLDTLRRLEDHVDRGDARDALDVSMLQLRSSSASSAGVLSSSSLGTASLRTSLASQVPADASGLPATAADFASDLRKSLDARPIVRRTPGGVLVQMAGAASQTVSDATTQTDVDDGSQEDSPKRLLLRSSISVQTERGRESAAASFGAGAGCCSPTVLEAREHVFALQSAIPRSCSYDADLSRFDPRLRDPIDPLAPPRRISSVDPRERSGDPRPSSISPLHIHPPVALVGASGSASFSAAVHPLARSDSLEELQQMESLLERQHQELVSRGVIPQDSFGGFSQRGSARPLAYKSGAHVSPPRGQAPSHTLLCGGSEALEVEEEESEIRRLQMQSPAEVACRDTRAPAPDPVSMMRGDRPGTGEAELTSPTRKRTTPIDVPSHAPGAARPSSGAAARAAGPPPSPNRNGTSDFSGKRPRGLNPLNLDKLNAKAQQESAARRAHHAAASAGARHSGPLRIPAAAPSTRAAGLQSVFASATAAERAVALSLGSCSGVLSPDRTRSLSNLSSPRSAFAAPSSARSHSDTSSTGPSVGEPSVSAREGPAQAQASALSAAIAHLRLSGGSARHS
eukprot:tig00021037_g17418.t1